MSIGACSVQTEQHCRRRPRRYMVISSGPGPPDPTAQGRARVVPSPHGYGRGRSGPAIPGRAEDPGIARSKSARAVRTYGQRNSGVRKYDATRSGFVSPASLNADTYRS